MWDWVETSKDMEALCLSLLFNIVAHHPSERMRPALSTVFQWVMPTVCAAQRLQGDTQFQTEDELLHAVNMITVCKAKEKATGQEAYDVLRVEALKRTMRAMTLPSIPGFQESLTSMVTKVHDSLHNFQHSGKYHIRLQVGEPVHVLQENGDWYFGYTVRNVEVRGIFPINYVSIRESVVDRSGPVEIVVPKQSPIVQEITAVLREWGTLWRHLYVNHSPDFEKIGQMMYELMRYRSKILSGTLPVDELRDIKQCVTSKVDMGNKMLGLDMVVRDEQGNILNPMLTSTIQLYWQHELATERIRQVTEGAERKLGKTVTQHSHILFVSVRNFVCKLNEDSELLMTLYDAREGRPITESYVVRWSREGLAQDLDQLHNLRVLFTDLGHRDLKREKVYLVCYVVRVGAMEPRETDLKRASQMPRKSIGTEIMRRPCGVAAMDVTLYLNGKIDSDEDKHYFIPFLQCAEKDTLDGTLKKILTIKDLSQRDHKGQGLWTSLKLLHGDIKQVREENPHLVLGSVSIARKMGFPEVILPGDVRNDLYLTLIGGEFSRGNKSTDKNLEVTVKVCNEKGQPIPGVIVLGGGVEPINEYRSVIYYHEDKPRWFETFKIAIPIEEFKGCHLKFTYKHRSSNETKDKSEKMFAMSYVKLMQENGTTLPDTTHELLVYKVDHKRFDESDLGYLSLPARRGDLLEGYKPQSNGLSLSSKDSLMIATNVCSTKLTQNVDLLGLLNWAGQSMSLEESLQSLMNVDGEEVVKFLQDVLDALFNILMQNPDSDTYDKKVFECLLFIIGLVLDRKYEHFQPVLDLYIKESFSATLAYNKLIAVLKQHIDGANTAEGQDKDILLKAMKSLQYNLKFIVRSRLLFSELYEGREQEQFEVHLKELLQSIVNMMNYNSDSTLIVQATCLKYLPTAIPDILEVFSATELSNLLAQLLCSLTRGRLAKQKMSTVRDIVHSELFYKSECRAVLLPVILAQIKELLELRDEMDLCVRILSDIMELLFRVEAGQTIDDITLIMKSVLRTVIQKTIPVDRESSLQGNIVAVMIAIFRQMSAHHFEQYIAHFGTLTDLLDFLMEILLVFRDLVSRPVYPKDWCDMIMLQNSVILKSLRHFSHTIRDYFTLPFEYQPWNNFFHCTIAFMTQPALQLDNFSTTKRARIISRYKDMRRKMGIEINSMWINLGQHKIQFIPSLVGPILEMTLIPEPKLRQGTIPIFFDMMQCEFYSSRVQNQGFGDTKRDSTNIKGNFVEFENEMIAKLDTLVEGGRGDEYYKALFSSIMIEKCENHQTMREQGIRFVQTVTRLLERLLEYRSVITDENKENRMSCTVNLLDFYSEINRKEMYIRYVNKLCELHLECDNFTEAAYTLKLHSKLLHWSDIPLPPLLRSTRYPEYNTHRELKEKIYYDMIDYFDKGKMWECALRVCKELVTQYEEETYDYTNLAELLKRMSCFYDNIMKQLRPEPEYFRVAFYGQGFPAFLQNKVFVYRGKEYERLPDFCSRTLNQFPNAELMNSLTLPGVEITESSRQCLQINNVNPVMDERKMRMTGKDINEQVLRYYRVNDVQKFRYSRPFHREPRDTENEFASLCLARTVLVTSYPLPGILRWFPVTASDTFTLSPIQNANETMETANKDLQELIIAHAQDLQLSLNPLSMKLNGMIDPAVMGGIAKYEKAFFTETYIEKHPEDVASVAKLKELIAQQIPLLEVGLQLHQQRAPQELQPFHQRMEECFAVMKSSVEQKYGKKACDLKLEPFVTMRRQYSRGTSSGSELHRLSEVSLNSEGGGSRSRVSSLTRSQVASLKNFASFSFSSLNTTGTLGRHSVQSKSHSSSFSATSSRIMLKASSSNSHVKATKREKREKDKTRSSSRKLTISTSSISPPVSLTTASTQWYTEQDNLLSPLPSSTPSNSSPIFELRQELTPKRPLRSEVEKERRLSRPSSGQFQLKVSNLSISISPIGRNGSHSNRDSIATTDSTASEEDSIPPPLPQKSRESDYCNLPDDPVESSKLIFSAFNPLRVRSKPVPPEPLDDGPPPTPPPKRPHLKPPTDNI